MSRLRTFLRLPMREKLMLPEALVLSGYYRYLTLHRPFARISPKIGTLGCETPETEVRDEAVGQVSQAVSIICNRTPWESKCLVRALTAKKMLNRRKLPCTMYMGVTLQENGEMVAHAWLRCGRKYVSGGNGSRQYTVTTIYGDQQEINN